MDNVEEIELEEIDLEVSEIVLDEVAEDEVDYSKPDQFPCIVVKGVTLPSEIEYLITRPAPEDSSMLAYFEAEGKVKLICKLDVSLDSLLVYFGLGYRIDLWPAADRSPVDMRDPDILIRFTKLVKSA